MTVPAAWAHVRALVVLPALPRKLHETTTFPTPPPPTATQSATLHRQPKDPFFACAWEPHAEGVLPLHSGDTHDHVLSHDATAFVSCPWLIPPAETADCLGEPARSPRPSQPCPPRFQSMCCGAAQRRAARRFSAPTTMRTGSCCAQMSRGSPCWMCVTAPPHLPPARIELLAMCFVGRRRGPSAWLPCRDLARD